MVRSGDPPMKTQTIALDAGLSGAFDRSNLSDGSNVVDLTGSFDAQG